MAFDGEEYAWRPQAGPQTRFVRCPVFEVVYGGARGGGKTDAALGDWANHAKRYGRRAKGLMVRRSATALIPTIERAKEIYGRLGATWQEQKSRFRFPNGASIRFNYLDRDADADAYMGHDYTRVYVEELTQFIDPGPVNKLIATLRSGSGVPVGFRATCNPGGPGHNWVKARYIDPGPYNIIQEAFVSPFTGVIQVTDRMFIPAQLTDNPILHVNDPGYEARLHLSGSAALVKAWLEGDWNIIEGAFFDTWSAKNIIRPFAIPAVWTRFRSFDWGFGAPFACHWWAVASDDHRTEDGIIPRGAMVCFREWYGSEPGKWGVGIRLTADQIAAGIIEREKADPVKVTYGVADPSIFAENGGPSHGEMMRRAGVAWRPADNKRVAGAGALSGWDQMRMRITGQEGRPMLYVFAPCRAIIETVPVLQHDASNLEDVDTRSVDHAADSVRYACMSRPLTAKHPEPTRTPPDRNRWTGTPELVNDWKTV